MFYEVILGRNMGRKSGILTYVSDEPLKIGDIIEVPIMRGKAAGVVYKKVAQPNFTCKKITKKIYTEPLPGHLIAAAKWISEYYVAPISAVMQMILPTGVLKKRRKTDVGSRRTTTKIAKTRDGFKITEMNDKKADIELGETETDLLQTGVDLQKNDNLGLKNTISRDIMLNPAQKMALEGLKTGLGATKLLLGVTGSGKTNIYLKRAENALLEQKSTILLVPEIALTGQLVKVFSEVFGDRIILIHSQQTEAERQKIFEDLLYSQEPKIVVGPRSALFAPLHDLGLIIIDEEHETTYYQENTPKYSAVRAASYIAEKLKIPCVLGSATPTVEDYYIAKSKESLVVLSEKAKKTAVKPEIKIIDFKNRDNFSKNRYFSTALLKSIERNLKTGRQSLIFHNRRGSSPLTICEDCGEELLCPNCFLPLTLHMDTYEMACHTCGYKTSVPAGCPKCGGSGLIHKGFGTKLLETEIARLFPHARVKRFDADNKKGETLNAVFNAVREGEVDVLVGTQMLAKGLDLPLLATVGVVQADAGLALPDFAAEEKVFQLLTQVFGRVGRGHIEQAEVFVQTYQPENPVLKFATEADYMGFSEYMLKKRRESGFPPFKFIAKVAVTMKTEEGVVDKIQEVARKLRKESEVLVSPPCPAFHERTARGFTWEITVRATSRKKLVKIFTGLDDNFHVSLDPPSLL